MRVPSRKGQSTEDVTPAIPGTGTPRRSEFTRLGSRRETALLLTPEEVAIRCALSRKSVYRAIERGELHAVKLCSRLRLRPADVDAWIDRGCIEPAFGSPLPSAPRGAPASNGLRSLLRPLPPRQTQ
jgi:excisionase family DNA binding protein